MMLLSVTAVLAIMPDDRELCSHPIFLKMDSIPCHHSDITHDHLPHHFAHAHQLHTPPRPP